MNLDDGIAQILGWAFIRVSEESVRMLNKYKGATFRAGRT